jgi:carboxylesterase
MKHKFKTAHSVEKFFSGSRIGVMLIHGLTGTPTEMASIGKLLNKKGFSVYCPLLPGHCVSEEELKKTSYSDWVAGMLEALESFSEHMDVVFTGGLSIGATLSMKLASLMPEKIRGQVLYSITLKYDGWTIPG